MAYKWKGTYQRQEIFLREMLVQMGITKRNITPAKEMQVDTTGCKKKDIGSAWLKTSNTDLFTYIKSRKAGQAAGG